MTPGAAITYLRRGRRVRASGIVIATRGGLAQVKPANGKWKSVWLTPAEIADGAAKLPPIPRRAAGATQELIPATLPPSESHQSPPKPVP